MSAAFEFNNLIFAKTEKAVIIRRSDREDLPHLAIFFETSSGEIDGHLKDELAPANSDAYTSLFRFPKDALNNFLEGFVSSFQAEFLSLLSHVERVRPRSLANRGYVIGVIHDEPFESAIWETAPKKRGKYRFDPNALKNLFDNIDPSMISLLPTSMLHSNELKNWPKPIYAVRAKGSDKLIALRYAPLKDGFHHWIRIDPIANKLPRIVQRLLPPEISKAVTDVWHKIHDALRLDELDISR